MNKKITLGVAVYNVENYLPQCLESIIKQEGSDIEILIADDGSDDLSGRISDEYARRDDRVRVIHKPNEGVSSARNSIIENASGEWIIFVDGDDMLSAGARAIFDENIDESCDIVCFDMQFFRIDNKISAYVNYSDPLIIEGSERDALRYSTMYSRQRRAEYINKNLLSSCGKAIKTDFIRKNGISFNENLTHGEDVLFNLQCLSALDKIKLVRRPFYLYRQRAGSAVHAYNPRIAEQNRLLAGCLKKYSADDEKMLDRYYLRCIADMYTVLQLNICHRDNPKSYTERLEDYRNFTAQDWCAEALEKANADELEKETAVVYKALKSGNFERMCQYCRHRQFVENIKFYSNKTGLHLILKPVMETIKGKGRK